MVTIKATHQPFVAITSNRTRDIHDALKRRCLCHWIDYPDMEKEKQIILARIEDIEEDLDGQVAGFMKTIRRKLHPTGAAARGSDITENDRFNLSDNIQMNNGPYPYINGRSTNFCNVINATLGLPFQRHQSLDIVQRDLLGEVTSNG
jgi:hypothetical protein